jgi:enolase-phosphatase E1
MQEREMPELNSYQAVLLDIEGTTTPVHFVYEVLFPYAQRELQQYLEQHWNDPDVQQDLDDMVAHFAELDRDERGRPDVPPRDQSNLEAFRSAVIQHIQWQMSEDQKNPPLKALQGRIWRAGYDQGELKAPVYEDVVEALKAWNERRIAVYIYSSGSVEAQKLLFGFSDKGDLREYLSGYFDTHTGPKKQAESYATISAEIGLPVDKVLFVTDNLDEALAADRAGMKVALANRPGNAPVGEHEFRVVETFESLVNP